MKTFINILSNAEHSLSIAAVEYTDRRIWQKHDKATEIYAALVRATKALQESEQLARDVYREVLDAEDEDEAETATPAENPCTDA